MLPELVGTWYGSDGDGCNITSIASVDGEIVSEYTGCEDQESNGVYVVNVMSTFCFGQGSGVYADRDSSGVGTCVYWSREDRILRSKWFSSSVDNMSFLKTKSLRKVRAHV